MTNFDDNTMNRLHDYGDRNIECSFIGNVTMFANIQLKTGKYLQTLALFVEHVGNHGISNEGNMLLRA